MDVIFNILFFGLGALSLYLTAYLRFKGRNKALLEDNQQLEEETQKVIAKYQAEAEELKKQHSLDIEKRKFQYEDKRLQFSKYFALLDQFHKESNSVVGKRFQPILNDFLLGFLNDNESVKNQAIVKYNEGVQGLIFDLNQEYLKIKTEQNSIRLIASPTVDELLDKLELAVKNATDANTEMLSFMSKQEFWEDQSKIAPFQEKLVILGQEVQSMHDALKQQMKRELNEI